MRYVVEKILSNEKPNLCEQDLVFSPELTAVPNCIMIENENKKRKNEKPKEGFALFCEPGPQKPKLVDRSIWDLSVDDNDDDGDDYFNIPIPKPPTVNPRPFSLRTEAPSSSGIETRKEKSKTPSFKEFIQRVVNPMVKSNKLSNESKISQDKNSLEKSSMPLSAEMPRVINLNPTIKVNEDGTNEDKVCWEYCRESTAIIAEAPQQVVDKLHKGQKLEAGDQDTNFVSPYKSITTICGKSQLSDMFD